MLPPWRTYNKPYNEEELCTFIFDHAMPKPWRFQLMATGQASSWNFNKKHSYMKSLESWDKINNAKKAVTPPYPTKTEQKGDNTKEEVKKVFTKMYGSGVF